MICGSRVPTVVMAASHAHSVDRGNHGVDTTWFTLGSLEKNWVDKVKGDPIKAIDPAVGLLELVSEISKVISFSFRLLGNMFAGMVLLFVMGYILSVANLAFFGLEVFVGLIQAIVFALLTLIFMNSATERHGGGEEHH